MTPERVKVKIRYDEETQGFKAYDGKDFIGGIWRELSYGKKDSRNDDPSESKLTFKDNRTRIRDGKDVRVDNAPALQRNLEGWITKLG